jgi:hypothetical protein
MNDIPIITGIPEIDVNILLSLHDEDLMDMCYIDKYINTLCNNNYFCFLKIKQIYPTLPLPEEYKNNLKQLYYKINNLDKLIDFAIDTSDQSILNWLILNHYQLYKENMRNIILYLNKLQLRSISYTEQVITFIDIIKFLIKNKKMFYTKDFDEPRVAFHNSFLRILEQVKSEDYENLMYYYNQLY